MSGGQIAYECKFDDRTILEADGTYAECLKIMQDEGDSQSSWCLISNLLLMHNFGASQMKLEFYHDGRIVIISFVPSDPDPIMNYDIRLLKTWAESNGWKTPEPSLHVLDERLAFWKHLWQCETIESSHLERRLGPRVVPETEEEPDEYDIQLESDDT